MWERDTPRERDGWSRFAFLRIPYRTPPSGKTEVLASPPIALDTEWPTMTRKPASHRTPRMALMVGLAILALAGANVVPPGAGAEPLFGAPFLSFDGGDSPRASALGEWAAP